MNGRTGMNVAVCLESWINICTQWKRRGQYCAVGTNLIVPIIIWNSKILISEALQNKQSTLIRLYTWLWWLYSLFNAYLSMSIKIHWNSERHVPRRSRARYRSLASIQQRHIIKCALCCGTLYANYYLFMVHLIYWIMNWKECHGQIWGITSTFAWRE
jgi:hypothetical protein